MLEAATVRLLHEVRELPDIRNNMLRELMAKAKFQGRTSETDWAYRKVLTHLEDGWTSVRSYSTVIAALAQAGVSVDVVGQIVNRIITGMRESSIGVGQAPTAHDMAAFVFYNTLTPSPVTVSA